MSIRYSSSAGDLSHRQATCHSADRRCLALVHFHKRPLSRVYVIAALLIAIALGFAICACRKRTPIVRSMRGSMPNAAQQAQMDEV